MLDGSGTGDTAAVRARAERVVAEPGVIDRAFAVQARVLDAVPIVDPAGRHERWFVPVVVGAALLGFVVLDRELVVHRWSTFQRQPGSLDGCPEVATWLDAERIVGTASTVAGAARPEGPPALGYDGAPDRIAWRVPLDDGRTAWVAGPAAWLAAAP